MNYSSLLLIYEDVEILFGFELPRELCRRNITDRSFLGLGDLLRFHFSKFCNYLQTRRQFSRLRLIIPQPCGFVRDGVSFMQLFGQKSGDGISR